MEVLHVWFIAFTFPLFLEAVYCLVLIDFSRLFTTVFLRFIGFRWPFSFHFIPFLEALHVWFFTFTFPLFLEVVYFLIFNDCCRLFTTGFLRFIGSALLFAYHGFRRPFTFRFIPLLEALHVWFFTFPLFLEAVYFLVFNDFSRLFTTGILRYIGILLLLVYHSF